MDGRLIGLVGGIAGSVIGVLGGIVGTYFSIKNTNGAKERAFVIRASVLCWIGVSSFLISLFLLPFVWRSLLWVAYAPILFWFIRWANKTQMQASADDKMTPEMPDHPSVRL